LGFTGLDCVYAQGTDALFDDEFKQKIHNNISVFSSESFSNNKAILSEYITKDEVSKLRKKLKLNKAGIPDGLNLLFI